MLARAVPVRDPLFGQNKVRIDIAADDGSNETSFFLEPIDAADFGLRILKAAASILPSDKTLSQLKKPRTAKRLRK